MERMQPKGLYHLFFAELWERFGFYMVQAILILVLTQELSFGQATAYLLFSVYGAMSFLTPIMGGYIADRWIGYKKATGLGAVLLILGYALMALKREEFLFFGMGLVVIGSGFFRPNITSLVGTLYHQDDPRREGGFTLFYLGINMGMLIPPLIAGYVVDHFGWSYGFWIAAIALAFSLIQFCLGRSHYLKQGNTPAISSLHRGKRGGFIFGLIFSISLFLALLQYLFIYPEMSDVAIIVATVTVLVTVFIFFGKETPERRRKFAACLILILLAMGFWAVYNQIYTTLTLFAKNNMAKQLFGIEIDAEFTQFFNPFFILLLSPFLGLLWIHLCERKINPSTPIKFSLGLLSVAVGMIILAQGTSFFATDEGIVSPWWLICCNFFIALGELLLYPVALAMISRLAPSHLFGTMIGLWFLSIGGAYAIGGQFALFAAIPQTVTKIEALPIYTHAFSLYSAVAFVLAIVGFSISPYLRRLIGERK